MKVIDAAGGRWDRKLRLHVFGSDPREVFGIALEGGTITSKKEEFQAFYTPPALADRIVKEAGVRRGSVVLEPSAGTGSIAQACLRAGVFPKDIHCLDMDPAPGVEQALNQFVFTRDDFLSWCPPERVCTFDAVVMNPPFTRGQDIAHVSHALAFPAVGCMLVSVMTPSWLTSDKASARALRTQLDRGYDWRTDPLPDGSFKESGTNVKTTLLIAKRR
jgi:predicted RNA methylase